MWQFRKSVNSPGQDGITAFFFFFYHFQGSEVRDGELARFGVTLERQWLEMKAVKVLLSLSLSLSLCGNNTFD